MDGRTADPTPDPQSVLRQLIRQAEAGTSSTSTLPNPQDTSSLHNDDTSSSDGDSDGSTDADQSDDDASSSSAAGGEPAQLLPYEQISTTLSTIAADRRELITLLQQKRHLITAHKRNIKHQRSLNRSLDSLVKARDELKSALHSLDVADILDAEDQALEVIRHHARAEDAAAVCPFTASMVRQIPLLRLQSIERAEYDNALGSRIWIEAEDQQLRMAVRAAALNAYTVALSLDPTFRGDPLEEAAKMDEASALQLAERIEIEQQPSSSGPGRRVIKGLDWATIAARMPTRSVEELRTRWNGVLRPSVNTASWSQQEVDTVIRLATPHLAAYLSPTQAQSSSSPISDPTAPSSSASSTAQAPIPWQDIARQLGTGRTAYACFVAFCSALVQRDQPEMASAEDDHIKELFSLFRGAWRFVALHDTASPNISLSTLLPASASTATATQAAHRPATLLGKVGRDPTAVYRRFRNTTDPALATGMWSLQEDLALIEAVRSVGRENWAAVAARVPGRTSSQCRERFNRRLSSVVDQMDVQQGTLDREHVAMLLENKKKLTWTKAMDEALLPYLDDDMKGRDGRTYASIAKDVARQVGVPLSDKNVRDRTAILRRKRAGAAPQPTEGSQKEQVADVTGSSTAQRSNDDAARDGGAPAQEAGEQPSTAREPKDRGSKDGGRARTTIVPGAKRRKL